MIYVGVTYGDEHIVELEVHEIKIVFDWTKLRWELSKIAVLPGDEVSKIVDLTNDFRPFIKDEVTAWLDQHASNSDGMPLWSIRRSEKILGGQTQTRIRFYFYRKEHASLFKLTWG